MINQLHYSSVTAESGVILPITPPHYTQTSPVSSLDWKIESRSVMKLVHESKHGEKTDAFEFLLCISDIFSDSESGHARV